MSLTVMMIWAFGFLVGAIVIGISAFFVGRAIGRREVSKQLLKGKE